MTVPYYMTYTWADPVIDVPGLIRYFDKFPTQREVSYFGPFSGVFHNNISQSPEDFLSQTTGKGNPYIHIVMTEALDFIDSL